MSKDNLIAAMEANMKRIALGYFCKLCVCKGKCMDAGQATYCATFQYNKSRVCEKTDIEKRLEEEQHNKLRNLRNVLEDVLNSEPLGSGDEEEDYIWETANTLKDALDDFFEEDADSSEEDDAIPEEDDGVGEEENKNVAGTGFTLSELYTLFSTLDSEALYRSIETKTFNDAVVKQEYDRETAGISNLWGKILQYITNNRYNQPFTDKGFTHVEMCLLASVLDSAVLRLTDESKGIKNAKDRKECMQEIVELTDLRGKVMQYLEDEEGTAS